MKWQVLLQNNPFDSRFGLFRVTTDGYIYGKGSKLSISLHPKLWYWQKLDREFRLTILGINIHFKNN
jgi:hypothetical protein